MPTSYFQLSSGDQSELLSTAAVQSNRAAGVIEKDIWLTFALQHLFDMPGAKPMAFKGGTSLSKVYSLIQRFSEDVDVTIDYRHLGCETPLSELKALSSRQRGIIGEGLKAKVAEYTNGVVLPHLRAKLAEHAGAQGCDVTISEDGEQLHIFYPSRIAERGSYLRDHVLLEFGGRNLIDPNTIHTIVPDIAGQFAEVAFPSASGVVVLAPERTFWEKVTLIHAQCNKAFPESLERVSRHWYDLAMLARHECGQNAKLDRALLANVIELKSVFFKSGTTHYERCLDGRLNLMPDDASRGLLYKDYERMHQAGMLNGHYVPMEVILGELGELQEHINAAATGA